MIDSFIGPNTQKFKKREREVQTSLSPSDSPTSPGKPQFECRRFKFPETTPEKLMCLLVAFDQKSKRRPNQSQKQRRTQLEF